MRLKFIYCYLKFIYMKTKHKLLLAVAVSGLAVTALYLLRKRHERKVLSHVSDEGYETATDILYPGKTNMPKVHYGPVIPQ